MSGPGREEHELSLSARRAELNEYHNATRKKAQTSSSPRAPPFEPRYAENSARPLQQRPLIDQISNKWQQDQTAYISEAERREFGLCDFEEEDSCPNLSRKAVASKPFRRMILLLAVFAGLLFFMWRWYFRLELETDWEMKEGFLAAHGNGTYGIAKGGDFEGVRVQDLDPVLVPGGEADPDGKRRLVFVGDIHGCADELAHLLKGINFDEETDHLITVGDNISKGPKNVEVLDELIRLKASSVRGNHEDRLLAMVPSVLQSGVAPPTEESTSKGFSKDAALLRQLHKYHIKYLRSMPLMIRIPALPSAASSSRKKGSPLSEEILVVHAGLVPAVPLANQDAYFVMNMRSIHLKTHVPLTTAAAKKSKSTPWHDLWTWYNDRLFRKKSLKGFRVWEGSDDEIPAESGNWLKVLLGKSHWPKPQVVIYGHHSKAGLQLSRWTKGLDTACVKGGELTALVLDAKGGHEIVSVGCKDHNP